MSITVPTSAQLAATFEGSARFIAAVLVAVYVAGQVTRDWVAGVATFAQRLTSRPLDTLIDLVPTVEPQPQPELIGTLGAILLTTEELEAEIAAYDAAQPAKPTRKTAARRKPATAPKVAVAA
jgi:hypothetical protein